MSQLCVFDLAIQVRNKDAEMFLCWDHVETCVEKPVWLNSELEQLPPSTVCGRNKEYWLTACVTVESGIPRGNISAFEYISQIGASVGEINYLIYLFQKLRSELCSSGPLQPVQPAHLVLVIPVHLAFLPFLGLFICIAFREKRGYQFTYR